MADKVVGVAEESTSVVGAPLPQDQATYKPALAGFGPEKVVTVFNPLSSNFRFQHARSVVNNQPLTPEHLELERKVGTPIRRDDMSPGLSHYSQYWILEAGKSKNLPGDIAQKAVQDLVNYILMSRAGKGQPKNVSDGYARAQVEKEIILNTSDNITFMNSTVPQDVADVTKQEIENLNPSAPESIPDETVAPADPPKGKGVTYNVPKSTKTSK